MTLAKTRSRTRRKQLSLTRARHCLTFYQRHERQLISCFWRQKALRRIDCSVTAEANGLVVLYLAGQFRGTWRWDGDAFEWTPAGYSAPQYRAMTATEAATFLSLEFSRLIERTLQQVAVDEPLDPDDDMACVA